MPDTETPHSDVELTARWAPSDPRLAERRGLRDRARLRRRLRHLRKVRELQLRDLGGLVYDLHRYGREHHALVLDKLDAVRATDRELRALEDLLEGGPAPREIREPGIGGACAQCGQLFSTDASYCWDCGAQVARGRTGRDAGDR